MTKTCGELKRSAKENLKGKYWYSFGVCLLVLLIGAITVGIQQLFGG